MALPVESMPLYPRSFQCFLHRLLRRIIMLRRCRRRTHRLFLLPYSIAVVSPAVSNALLWLFGNCQIYDALHITRFEARLRRLLRRIILQRHASLATPSRSTVLLRKYLLRQRLRYFVITQRRGRLSSRTGGRSTVVRETSSIRPLDYQSFVKNRNSTLAPVEGECSKPLRRPPIRTSQHIPVPPPPSAFHSYFSSETGPGSEMEDASPFRCTGIDDISVSTSATSRVHRRPLNHLLTEYEFCDFGPPDTVCKYCEAVMWSEERSNQSSPAKESNFSICCMNGKVKLPFLQQPPLFLRCLLEFSDARSVQFRKDIRAYNSIFAFTSLGAQIDHSINNGRGPYIFKLSGQNYHRIGTLLPAEGVRPKFAQIYFYDSDNELRNRLGALGNEPHESDLDPDIVSGLIEMFSEHNVLAKAFKSARERIGQDQLIPFSLRLIGTRHRDARQYNLPTASEVAALIVGNELDLRHQRDIIVQDRGGGLQRIPDTHPSFMAMQYPILFPYGEDGYMPNILTGNAEDDLGNDDSLDTISNRAFITYRLHFRLDEAHTLLLGGRLFQQYIVDAFTCIEAQRLRWYRDHQSQVRAELYQNLVDAVLAGDSRASSVGRRIVLPASFTGALHHNRKIATPIFWCCDSK